MLRVITLMLYFFRELVFDSKEEYTYTSKQFNVKKVLLFILISVMALANAVFLSRIYNLAVENATLKKELHTLTQKNTSTLPSDSGKRVSINQPEKPG